MVPKTVVRVGAALVLPSLFLACSSSSSDAGRSDAGSTHSGGGTQAINPADGGGASHGSGGANGGTSSSGGTTSSGGSSVHGGSTARGGSSGRAGSTSQSGGASGDTADAASPDGATVACSGVQPGPTNTGVPPGTKLSPSGSITVKQDGQIVQDLDIAGTITVLANDVLIRRVHIKTGDYYPIRYFDNDNTGLVVEDSEIEGTSGNVTSAVAFSHYTARRLNVHGGADGLKADEDVLIEGCWIHDLSNGPGEHNDGVQSTGGKGVTIRGNSISGGSNSCVQTGDEGKVATEDLTVECNWLSGGGYTLNIRGTGATKPRGTRVVNNRFKRDYQYGPWVIDDPSPVVTGNVDDDTGAPIPFP